MVRPCPPRSTSSTARTPARPSSARCELKGIAYRRVELPPLVHAADPARALRRAHRARRSSFDDGEKVVGLARDHARARRAGARAAAAARPTRPRARRSRRPSAGATRSCSRVARRLLWPALPAPPARDGRPTRRAEPAGFPTPVAAARSRPSSRAVERRLNDATDDAVRADLRALPGHLDRDRRLDRRRDALGGERRPTPPTCRSAPTLAAAADARRRAAGFDARPRPPARPDSRLGPPARSRRRGGQRPRARCPARRRRASPALSRRSRRRARPRAPAGRAARRPRRRRRARSARPGSISARRRPSAMGNVRSSGAQATQRRARRSPSAAPAAATRDLGRRCRAAALATSRRIAGAARARGEPAAISSSGGRCLASRP